MTLQSIDSTHASWLSIGVTSGFFFVLMSWLPRTLLWKKIETALSQYMDSNKVKDLSFGIRFRVVCTIHNLVQTVLGLIVMTRPVIWRDSLHGSTPLSNLVVAISAGFFIWDLTMAILSIKRDGLIPVFHGTVATIVLCYCCVSGCCHFYGIACVLWEVSTPFVHARWILYKIGMETSKLYYYNGVVMIFVFGVSRVLWGTFVAVKFFTLSESALKLIPSMTVWGLRFLCMSANGLNYYWFSLMLRMAYRKITKAK